jgi:hydroxymethylpyrimidine/phosphomethylpyrimidine kinase
VVLRSFAGGHEEARVEPDRPPLALSIAGSDPSGGAGIQADLKTFEAHGVYGMAVITALTAQNTLGVRGFEVVAAPFVRQQIDAVLEDIGTDAAKTGMLASAAVMDAVAAGLAHHRVEALVVDPVAASKHGDPLLEQDAVAALREVVVPLALVATPNLGEVELLTGVEVTGVDDLPRAGDAMLELGCRWVLIKGGHLEAGEEAVDLLTDGRRREWFSAPRLDSRDTHGTGCTLAAAITARLAAGDDLVPAVRSAKDYLTGALRRGVRIGSGIGPVDHRWRDR